MARVREALVFESRISGKLVHADVPKVDGIAALGGLIALVDVELAAERIRGGTDAGGAGFDEELSPGAPPTPGRPFPAFEAMTTSKRTRYRVFGFNPVILRRINMHRSSLWLLPARK
jgi:hypothetical protein